MLKTSIHKFGLLENKKPFPKVNSVPSLIPLFNCSLFIVQGHLTIMWHFILNPEIQLHSHALTPEHQLYVRALHNRSLRTHSVQQLIEIKPTDAIRQTLVRQGFLQLVKKDEEKLIDVGTKVRYLCEPGELEGQQYGRERRRSTDPVWLVDVYKIKDRYFKEYQPTLYCLNDGPKRSFVFEELQPIQDPQLFHPICYLVLSMLIYGRDWVSVDSNLPYLTLVISSGERNYMKKAIPIVW